jgi:hypothetical protein
VGAELLRDQELLQAPHDCDPARDGRADVPALIEIGDIVPHLLQADIIQYQAIFSEPREIAVEIVGVGSNGAGRYPKLRGQGIEPQLSQPGG